MFFVVSYFALLIGQFLLNVQIFFNHQNTSSPTSPEKLILLSLGEQQIPNNQTKLWKAYCKSLHAYFTVRTNEIRPLDSSFQNWKDHAA